MKRLVLVGALILGGCGDGDSPSSPADAGPTGNDAGPSQGGSDAGGVAEAGVIEDGGSTSDASPMIPADITAQLEVRRAAEGLIALGGAVVNSEGLLAVGASGRRSLADTVPVTAEDRWHLGSDTKSMTAMLAAILVEKGSLRWEATLAEVFSDFAAEMSPGYGAMTVVELVSHRSGLPNVVPPDLWMELWRNQGTIVEQRERFARALLGRAPSTTPGTTYEYSNAGFMVAGAMMERLTGRAWEDLMRTELFEPLGMTGCGFGPAATVGQLDAPLGHREGSPPSPVPAGPDADNPPALGPAGTVHCPLSGWAQYIAAHLRQGTGRQPILPPDAFARLQADPGIGSAPEGFGYGYGWFVVEQDWGGGPVLNHAGSNTMNYAVAWVAPLRNRAYLVVTNYAGPNVPVSADRAVGDLLGLYPP
ncbi:MAG: serine hydrolase domain-containing protein [Myxococcota bacterium]